MKQNVIFCGAMILVLVLTFASLVFAVEGGRHKSEKKPTDFLNYYFDSREYNNLTLMNGARKLPWDFSIWGFVDINGDQNRPSKRFELTRYFIEYRLSREVDPNWVFGIKGIRLETEYNGFNGRNNDLVRFGATFKRSFKLVNGRSHWIQWRFHPLESDGSGMQTSMIYFFSITPRISISGFADYNINSRTSNKWLAEPQLNFSLNKTFDLVVEGRYNGFEDQNPNLDGLGIAGGLAVKF
jgi:hypothetical protein